MSKLDKTFDSRCKHGSSTTGVSRLCSPGPLLQVYECDTTTQTHTRHVLRLHVPQAAEPVATCRADTESSENCRVSLIARETLERGTRGDASWFFHIHTHTQAQTHGHSVLEGSFINTTHEKRAGEDERFIFLYKWVKMKNDRTERLESTVDDETHRRSEPPLWGSVGKITMQMEWVVVVKTQN